MKQSAIWKTEMTHTILYSNFDRLVKEHLGIEYEVCADEELPGDAVTRIGKLPPMCWDDGDEHELKLILGGKKARYISRLLAYELNRRGILPDGHWMIES